MTKDEILVMKPGKELNVLVAEHVFGWRKVPGPTSDYKGPCESFDVLVPPTIDDPFPLYPPTGSIKPWWFCRNWSNDISAAWEVLENIGGQFFLRKTPSGKYAAGFLNRSSTGDTAPEAICKAALIEKIGDK